MAEYYAVRLDRGQDLRQEIRKIVTEKKIQAGYIATAVGCLQKLHIRLAEANGKNDRLHITDQNFEVTALSGTLSPTGLHVHISVADSTGKAFGGHLLDGCEVYYYVELIIVAIKSGLHFSRTWTDAPLDSEDEGSFTVATPVPALPTHPLKRAASKRKAKVAKTNETKTVSET